ncbi:MAG: cysteine--tRNA ligase [Vampirovibrio sp.]|nr:cysteine--tRNA ligase [Vampirovibrio sp.]
MLPSLQFYNSLTRTTEPFQPIEAPTVKLYVCGPTVYDFPHLGHARCYMSWDVLVRTLMLFGYTVTYVRNITDVDDKILARAEAQSTTPEAVAELNTQRFHEDMQALNTLSPTVEPKATDHIKGEHGMFAMIETLIAKKHAYVTATGDVNFETATMADYGKLSKRPPEAVQAGARVSVDADKRHPSDFALWKANPEDSYAWNPPEGLAFQGVKRGRPGWHIECSSMIRTVLGETIDIHAGGADLIFPHHENEIAQSECCSGKTPFVRTWMHNGFVNVDGEKMSKSLGNFSTIRDLLEHYPANTLRYFILTNHYRMPVDFTPEALDAAHNWSVKFSIFMTQLLPTFPAMAETLPAWEDETARALLQSQLPEFLEALASDLNTPRALASVNGLVKQLRKAETVTEKQSLLTVLLIALQVLGFRVADFLQIDTENGEQQSNRPTLDEFISAFSTALSAEQVALFQTAEAWESGVLALRAEAKRAKNWALADAIRSGVEKLGGAMTDTPQGSSISW